jgi:hypothetical protein
MISLHLSVPFSNNIDEEMKKTFNNQTITSSAHAGHVVSFLV